MPYEWDEDKRQSNIDKHRIDFQAVHSFEWATAVTEPSPRGGEMRYTAIGYVGIRLHTVIYTERGGVTRIISLRPSSAKERADYAQA